MMKKLLIVLFAAAFFTFAVAGCEMFAPNTSESGSEVTDTSESGSADVSESSSYVQPDTVAPVITLDVPAGTPVDEQGRYVFTAGLNEAFTLPAATAVDDVDGDITDNMSVAPDLDANTFVKDGVFTSKVLGEHVVTYYAVDAAENETYVDIIVKVASDDYADTFDVTGYEDIDALSRDGGIFKENFAKGAKSPLIMMGMPSVASLEAGENALDGNSLVIDYGKYMGASSAAYIPNADRYLKKGKWTISFDLKLVSGNAPAQFYFGYVKQGETVSTDKLYNLTGMEAGTVRKIEWQAVLDIPANAETDESSWYHLHFFEHSGNCNAVVALDNFVIRYDELFIPTTTIPTFEQLKAGFTFDWENTYMALEAAEPVAVDKIANAEAKAAIKGAESGFSNVVLLLNGASHAMAAPKKSIDADTFQKGWVYTFEFDYYTVKAGGHYFIAYDGSSGNHNFASGFFKSGLGHSEVEYTVADKDYALTIYMTGNEDEVYLGNFKITLKEPEYTREDYHDLTSAEVLAEGGYTFDFAENNAMKLNGQGKYMLVDNMEDATLKAAIEGTNAFTKGIALRYKAVSNSGGVWHDLTPALVVGKEYTVTFNGYAAKNGTILMLPFQGGKQVPGRSYEYTKTANADGTTSYSVTFTHEEGVEEYNLYCTSECELYIATVNVAAVEPEVKYERNDYHTLTLAEVLAEGGYTYDFSENNAAKFTGRQEYVLINNVKDAELKAALQSTGAFTQGVAMYYSVSGSGFIDGLT
ncbi:MAG: hypothetical protein IJR61_02400, partial [Clostridia bacterium]|nr:hypothetical protein [Clostridia bacterium]